MATNTTDLARYTDSATGADVELSIDEIKRTFCPKATDQEAANFLHLCRYMGLNPFVKDAYLIKYGDGAATMVVGKDAFMKRADSHPQFAGIVSGVIVKSDGKIENRTGTLVLSGDEIVGGWARIARNDRKVDVDVTVTFSEFNNSRGLWKTMPAVMIEKCAIVTGLRRAFPATFAGMYDSAEMGVELSDNLEPVLTNGAPIVVDAPVSIEASHDDRIAAEVAAPVVVPVETVEEIVAATQNMIAEANATPDNSDKDGHNNSAWEVVKSPATGTRRWAHAFSYELNGKLSQGWCVYDGDVPVPPLPSEISVDQL